MKHISALFASDMLVPNIKGKVKGKRKKSWESIEESFLMPD